MMAAILAAVGVAMAQDGHLGHLNLAAPPDLRPFDPFAEGACEKAVGGPPDSDWIGDQRGWVLHCGELDISVETAELVLLRKAQANKSKAERGAFDALVASFQSYRAMQLDFDNKGCGGGNGCGAMNAEDEAYIYYKFIALVEGVKNKLPSYSASEVSGADAALNAAYKLTLASLPAKCPEVSISEFDGCISQTFFRSLGRAWFRYRDSWVAYGAIAWPTVNGYSWRTYLALQRTRETGLN
jgi:uncharacterized protein YecT (DUF1311 family)